MVASSLGAATLQRCGIPQGCGPGLPGGPGGRRGPLDPGVAAWGRGASALRDAQVCAPKAQGGALPGCLSPAPQAAAKGFECTHQRGHTTHGTFQVWCANGSTVCFQIRR